MEQHSQEIGTRRDLVLYRLETILSFMQLMQYML